MKDRFYATFVVVGVWATVCHAQVWAGVLSYQGSAVLSVGAPVPDGDYDMRFSLFSDAVSGSAEWGETDLQVPVRGGLFSTSLGDGTSIPITVLTATRDLWLQVEIDLDKSGTFGPDEVYYPRQRLAAAPWAFDAERLMGMAPSDFAPATHYHHGTDVVSAVATATVALSVDWLGVGHVPAAEGDLTGTYPALTVQRLQGRPVSETPPTSGQLLGWDGAAWTPTTPPAQQFPNLPPVAVLQANPPAVALGGQATLSLAQSYDPEGGALAYAFDPEGTGFGLPAQYGTNASTSVVYSEAGTYLAAGWVRDVGGDYARAQALISVGSFESRSYTFTTTTVDTAGAAGAWTSLNIVDGNPAVAYYDPALLIGRYVRSTDVTGGSWGTPMTVVSGADLGSYASLVVVDGNPAIAHRNITSGDLNYIHAADATGTSWGTNMTLDGPDNVGRYCVMAIVNGHPAIAYGDSTNSRLKYIQATDASGSSWGTPVVVNSAGNNDGFCSLAVVNGRPAIAHMDKTTGYLLYVRALDSDGNSWGTPKTLDSDASLDLDLSLAIVAGCPAIAYHDGQPSGGLKYVRAVDADGTSWRAPITVDSNGDVGQWASLAVINGIPGIAYHDGANFDLKYVEAADAAGKFWGAPMIVDSVDHKGAFCSLAEVNGRPAISYFDWTNEDLIYAIGTPH